MKYKNSDIMEATKDFFSAIPDPNQKEQIDENDLAECPECKCTQFSYRSIYGPGVPEVRIEFCDACGVRKPTSKG